MCGFILFFSFAEEAVKDKARTTKSFNFAVDAAGRKFATMARDEASKNHRGGVNEKPSDEKETRIYAGRKRKTKTMVTRL